MEKKQPNFQEQDAPLKNTDNAFVKVRKEGFAQRDPGEE